MFDELILHLDSPPHEGAWNMAVDQAWLEMETRPVLRVYGWKEPTVTLGYAQSLPKLAESLPGWPVVRRWTGGGVVLHEKDFTYSVIVPAVCAWAQTSPLESYRAIHASLAEALVAVGFHGSRLAGPEDLIENAFCFVAPALHDVILGAVKISGAGQRRGKLGLLHQGSVQQVVLKPDFWQKWAAQISRKVIEVHEMPVEMKRRAEELAVKRYSLPQWLSEREDEL
jgi:lipoyl(octanoyl) transferase